MRSAAEPPRHLELRSYLGTGSEDIRAVEALADEMAENHAEALRILADHERGSGEPPIEDLARS